MKKFIDNILSLKENTDFEKTKTVISEGVALRGYNLWILLCSTILASIGLDTNSTAVIIGAMLISPLMSPILGVGFSVAIHDRRLLTRSFRDLFLAVVISLAASVLYFFFSPLGQPTPELQARTFPTLLDVLIALFGGIAGIVSISRTEQTNAIPGVAIATALMPPLCTAGFGIATARWSYFLGAFYLFFINAVFISLATYVIVRYLHFPEKEFVNKRMKNQYQSWFIILSMTALTPSIYFLYTVYNNEIEKKDIQQLVLQPIENSGNEILKWDILDQDSLRLIKVYYSGKLLNDSLRNTIEYALNKHNMKLYRLISIRVNLTKEEVSQLTAEAAKQMFQEMHVEELQQQNLLNNKAADTLSFAQVFSELKVAFPFIDTASNGWIMLPDSSHAVDTIPAITYKVRKYVSRTQTKQLYNYLKLRFGKDTVVLIKQ